MVRYWKRPRSSGQSFPEVTYAFVGDGPLKGELIDKATELGIRDRVVFTGFRNDSEALMKEFDVFCLASDSEGLSSAILAAMATPYLLWPRTWVASLSWWSTERLASSHKLVIPSPWQRGFARCCCQRS